MDFACSLTSHSTVIYKLGQGIVLNELTPEGIISGGRICVLNAAKRHFTDCFKRVAAGVGRSCLFTVPCSLSAAELADYKSVAYSAGVTAAEFIPSTLAIAAHYGHEFNGTGAAVSIDIGTHGTDITVIRGAEVIGGGTIEDGRETASLAVRTHIEEKHSVELDTEYADSVLDETATLLLNDEVSFKLEDIGYFSGIDCYKILYPIFARISKAVLQTILECPEEVQNEIKSRPIYVGGGFTKITGIREFLTSTLDSDILLSADSINAAVNGAGRLLADTQLIKRITRSN